MDKLRIDGEKKNVANTWKKRPWQRNREETVAKACLCTVPKENLFTISIEQETQMITCHYTFDQN